MRDRGGVVLDLVAEIALNAFSVCSWEREDSIMAVLCNQTPLKWPQSVLCHDRMLDIPVLEPSELDFWRPDDLLLGGGGGAGLEGGYNDEA